MVQIRDVAREADVSVATVSRILANTGYPVRAATRERVLEAASRLGYQPNALGRSLRTGRSSAVGLCATTLNNPTAISAIEGIVQSCRAVGRHVQVASSFWDPREEASQLQLFLQERMAGMVGFPAGAPAEGYRRLQEAGVPVVLLNRGVPGLVAPIVRHDFAGGYAGAVAHLASTGHRRIAAVLTGRSENRVEHAVGWAAAFERLGLETPRDLVREVGSSSHEREARRAVQDLLALPDRPTALVTGTVLHTLVALRVLQEVGLDVPEDVALVGTGDERWEILFPPHVPFVCLDSFGLGTTAAEILNDLIDSGQDVRSDREAVIGVRFVDTAEQDGER